MFATAATTTTWGVITTPCFSTRRDSAVKPAPELSLNLARLWLVAHTQQLRSQGHGSVED